MLWGGGAGYGRFVVVYGTLVLALWAVSTPLWDTLVLLMGVFFFYGRFPVIYGTLVLALWAFFNLLWDTFLLRMGAPLAYVHFPNL